MATKSKFTAIAPDGTKLTRVSDHEYTHAVICFDLKQKNWGCLGFSSSRQLAERTASKYSGKDYSYIFSGVQVVEATKSEAISHKFVAIMPDGSKLTYTTHDEEITHAVICQDSADGKWKKLAFTSGIEYAERNKAHYEKVAGWNDRISNVTIVEAKEA